MKRVLIFVTLALVAMQAVGQGKKLTFGELALQNPSYAASILYAAGVQHKLLGDPQRAFNSFTELLKINPNHAAAHYQIATLATRTTPSAKVLEHAQKAYQLDTTNTVYLMLYVQTLARTQEFQKAFDLLSVRQQNGTLSQSSYYYMIMLSGQLGDMTSVENLSLEYLNRWGFNPQVVEIFCSTMLSRGRYAQVDKLLTEYLRDYPTEPSIRISLAKLRASLSMDDEAIELYKSAIDLDSTNYESFLALSDYYRIKHDLTNFVRTLEPVFSSKSLNGAVKAGFFEQTFFDPAILKENYFGVQSLARTMYASAPDDPEVERVYIRFMMYCGEAVMVRPLLLEKISRGTATIETYKNVVELYSYEKQSDSTLHYAHLAEKRFPKDPDFPLMAAYVYSVAKDDPMTLKSLKKAFSLAQSDSLRSIIKTFEGDTYYQSGNKRNAFKAYDKALKFNPNYPGLLNNYAYFLSVDNIRLDDALRMSQRANEIEDGNPTYLDTQAWVLYQLGRYEEARTVQRRAIALESTPSDVLLMHYADILFKLGNEFLAETYWKKALDAGADPAEIQERLKLIK